MPPSTSESGWRLLRGSVLPTDLARLPPGRELDQPGTVEHPDVDVEVARVDAEPLGELAVRERLAALGERLEDLQAKRVPERLQLLGLFDQKDVGLGSRGVRSHAAVADIRR